MVSDVILLEKSLSKQLSTYLHIHTHNIYTNIPHKNIRRHLCMCILMLYILTYTFFLLILRRIYFKWFKILLAKRSKKKIHMLKSFGNSLIKNSPWKFGFFKQHILCTVALYVTIIITARFLLIFDTRMTSKKICTKLMI